MCLVLLHKLVLVQDFVSISLITANIDGDLYCHPRRKKMAMGMRVRVRANEGTISLFKSPKVVTS